MRAGLEVGVAAVRIASVAGRSVVSITGSAAGWVGGAASVASIGTLAGTAWAVVHAASRGRVKKRKKMFFFILFAFVLDRGGDLVCQ